jgi:hypothetical protein
VNPAGTRPPWAASSGRRRRPFLDATAGRGPRDALPTPWYAPQATLPVLHATCLLLGEQVIHGRDIARAFGRRWPVPHADACLMFHGVRSMVPLAVDADAVRGVTAAFDVWLRRGPRAVVRIREGRASVDPWEPGSGPVDCHVSADPATFMLVGYGRISQWRAVAGGRLLAWGRRPWLALRLVGYFSSP